MHSVQLMSASTASKAKNENDSFQYVPCWWVEVYASFEERWITIDCIQGAVEERNRLESRNHVHAHAFVLAVDVDGRLYDLTRKYASDFEGKTFKLRKDEDKWLGTCLTELNFRASRTLIGLPDREARPALRPLEGVPEIPKTLAAIKNHSILMLASQLKKYEVFYPIQKPAGLFKDEPVFLRESVQKVRSKDAWLSQCARVVKVSRSLQHPLCLNHYRREKIRLKWLICPGKLVHQNPSRPVCNRSSENGKPKLISHLKSLM